tara:strand:+ start:155 stop:775 length:621 start_codon:yes stop_codon:yes gene_type:complete
MKYSDKYKFTQKWFDPMIPMWEQVFKKFPNIENVLEVGCFEGRATVWLCENVLNNQDKTYTYDVIDTFGGSLNESGMWEVKKNLEKSDFIWDNFTHNISFFPHINFNIDRGFSQKILPTMESEEKYDLIYIDASHRADDTLVDAYYAKKMLKKGGIIIFDDYGWKDPKNMHQVNSPELGINVFNTMYDNEFQVIFKGYQVVFLKNK